MTTRTIKVEIPFQRLLTVIDQLTLDEKLVIKKRLERGKTATWQERFGNVLRYLGDKNKRFSEKEVAEDVKRAITEVRSGAKK